MDNLHGVWMPDASSARDFVLFLTTSNKYFIISRSFTSGNADLAIEWGQYKSEFVHTVNDGSTARMSFSREGCDGTDRDISTFLQTDWFFVPPRLGESQLSEIRISKMRINRLIRCNSIEFS